MTEAGRPDYENANWDDYGPATLDSYLDGTSMGGADDVEAELVDTQGLPLVNNVPEIDAGYYGAAGSASAFNAEEDGETVGTVVEVRYTFELQRPNLSQLKHTLDFSEIKETSKLDFKEMGDEQAKQFAAQHIDGLEVSDIDAGNSEIVMNGEDDNANFQTPSGIPYSSLVANKDSHVGIISAKSSFRVWAKNEASDSGVTGGTGATAE